MPGSSDGKETGQVCLDSDDNTKNCFFIVSNQEAKGVVWAWGRGEWRRVIVNGPEGDGNNWSCSIIVVMETIENWLMVMVAQLGNLSKKMNFALEMGELYDT